MGNPPYNKGGVGTGSPYWIEFVLQSINFRLKDDGYLTSSAAQNAIAAQNDPDAFRYLYSLKVNNPSNYSLPRMWRAGLSIQF